MKHPLVSVATVVRRTLFAAAGVTALCAVASAQFNDEWVGFVKDNSRLVVASSLGENDTEEKDYAVGDLNNNGWTDVVVVRKQPFTSSGRRTNVLLMNEGGMLVDRTAEYATASTVPGDMGFLTPTNDRDVVLADVDGDGWLDIITATTLSGGQPKHISHPRVYMNLGNDAQGNWLGFEYQEHRFPQLYLSNGTPCWPKFCAVAAGDVTGNGLPDLYFADYDSGGGTCGDMNDRLLINDGTGVFVDESTLRMQSSWLQSCFGTSAAIVDMNGNGVNDIVRDSALGCVKTTITYNDPSNEGFFNLHHTAYGGAGYFVSVGDLNRDDRIDLVITDDGSDRYLLNQGNDAFGRATFSSAHTFQFVTGGDDGFGGNNMVVDLDNDGWPDVIIADVDVDIPGCGRRMHIYHNRGGTVGGHVTLREEAGSSGWRGAVGLFPDDLRGTFDVAVLDINNNGFLDLVIGRCSGTAIWMNTLGPPSTPPGTAYCACDGTGGAAPCGNVGSAGEGCANSTGTGATLAGLGSASVASDDLAFNATGLVPAVASLLFAGDETINAGNGATFGDGLRCAGVNVVRLGVKFSSAAGTASWGPSLAATGGWGAGDTRRFQVWYRDPSGSPCGGGFNLTGGYEVDFTP